MSFLDTQRVEGHAVESICRVLREQGCQVAARTYRAWRQDGRRVSARTVTDAAVVDAVRAAAWTTRPDSTRVLTAEGLYGRRKMLALLRRTTVPDASRGAVDRAMRLLELTGVRRDKGVRTTIPAKDGIRAGDLLDRNFTAPASCRSRSEITCHPRAIRVPVLSTAGPLRTARDLPGPSATRTAPDLFLQVRGRFRTWWRVKGSNLRRLSRQIYSLLPLTTRATRPGAPPREGAREH